MHQDKNKSNHNMLFTKSKIMKPVNVFIIATGLFCLAVSAYADERPLLTEVKEKWLAEDFTLKDENGKSHTLSDYRGKVVVINFWATWCPPCLKEMPSMERAHKNWSREGIEILAINVGEDEDSIFAFTGEHDISFTVLLDEDSSVLGLFPSIGLPTTYVIDPKGYVIYRAVGDREWDDPKITEKLRLLRKVKK